MRLARGGPRDPVTGLTRAIHISDSSTALNILVFAIVAFAGWTLAANVIVMAGGSLQFLLVAGPLAAAVGLCSLARISRRLKPLPFTNGRVDGGTESDPYSITPAQGLVASALITALLAISWLAFWLSSVLFLAWTVWKAKHLDDAEGTYPDVQRRQTLAIAALCLVNAVLAFVVCRPDQDDAFYVGVAAFAAGHPTEPLLAFDPMLVERSWPLIFPSYRFASYELLVAAIAKVISAPALSVAHLILPPLGGALSILASYALARELRMRNVLAITVVTATLTIVLGETARSPANFAFDRIFQGKAILLSVVIPTIYAFTIRHVREAGSGRNIYVLACAYVAAVGVSNFGMLIAPVAGLTAAAAMFRTANLRRVLQAASCAVIPLPYLLWVAITSHGGAALANVGVESGGDVWASTFGPCGQYFISFMLLAGPTLAVHRRGRWLLAIPTLLMLGIAMNPLFAPIIAMHVTTPPVFWRMTWMEPTLIMVAASLTLLFRWCTSQHFPTGYARFIIRGSLAAVSVLILFLLTQASTLRAENGVTWSFGEAKLVNPDVSAAARLIQLAPSEGRILAPDNIASIISMSEHHPPLVFARSMYVYMLRDALPQSDYEARMRLAGWLSGTTTSSVGQIAKDLIALNVVIIAKPANASDVEMLEQTGYVLEETVTGLQMWRRRSS